MLGPDQDLKDFPPWIWPYIRVADLAEISKVVDVRVSGDASARVPETAINAHVMAIISALTMRKVAAGIDGDIGRQFAASANRALSVAIDDCGSTGPKKPWPTPPRHVALMQIAAHLAVAAAELEGDEILHKGLKDAVGSLVKLAGHQ